MKNLRILKVKANDDGVAITYQQKAGKTSWSKITLESPEKAKPELYEALKALAPHVVTLCELPGEYEDDIAVIGVNFTFDETLKTYGARIVATKSLVHSDTPFKVSTPHKTEPPEHIELKGDALVFLTEQCAEDLRILRAEARDYIKGDRAQTELFTSEKIPPMPEDDEDDQQPAKAENVIPANGEQKSTRKSKKKETEPVLE